MAGTSKLFKYSLILLAVGVSLKAWRDQREASKVKSAEQYWAETGIEATALSDLIDDQTCVSSERYFLACANAVMSVASRYNLQLTLAGKLAAADKVSGSINSEKQLLEPWKELFKNSPEQVQKISFFSLWNEVIDKYVPAKQKEMMLGAGLNGFISVFRDPHTYLMPIAFYREVVAKVDNKSASIGIILGRTEKNYFVRKVYAGSPAEKADLRKGDILLAVNDTVVSILMPMRVNELMRGEAGNTLSLGVRRGDKNLVVEILREQSTVPTVSFRLLDGIKPVGVVTVNKFARQTCEKTKEAILALQRQNIRGLLLDLRDNPGGQMEEAACVASLFVGNEKRIFEIRYLDPIREREVTYGSENQIYNGPMAILINSGSASAAEIVAGALRDLKRGLLVGETSFGKGSFQEGEVWAQNKKIALFETKGFYYLPSGTSPQMRGLEPDVKVTFKDTLQIREVDQYINPLQAPQRVSGQRVTHMSMRDCLDIEDGSLSKDDPELSRARQALFCKANTVAGADK